MKTMIRIPKIPQTVGLVEPIAAAKDRAAIHAAGPIKLAARPVVA